jgi:uncharacterized membrane protein YczE
LQIILLRKEFQIKNLLQVVVGIIFGNFTTFCNWGASFLPTPQNLAVRLVMMAVSIVIIAIGIFFYLPSDIMLLAGEGAMQAVSKITGIVFHKVKVGFDISMVVISLVICLIFLRSLGSVGIGTVTAAVCVGLVLGRLNNAFGAWRDKLIGKAE